MRYRSAALLVILLALTIPISTQEDIKVEFEDPGLEEAIREAIKKPSGDIYASELKELKEFSGGNWNEIKYLGGIEHCTSLEGLDLIGNKISDLSPLAGLASIQVLYLDNNKIIDISRLANLASLEVLYLNNNKISELSLLTGLGSLKELLLDYNQISDLGPLTDLPFLILLYLKDNQLNKEAKYNIIPKLKEKGVDVKVEY